MVVRSTTSCAISAYHHLSYEFESRSWWVVFDTTLCDQVSQRLVAGRWFSPGTPVSSTNTTDSHNIIQILVKVELSTISLTHSDNVTNKQLNIWYIFKILVNNLTCKNGYSAVMLLFIAMHVYHPWYNYKTLTRRDVHIVSHMICWNTRYLLRKDITKHGK